MHIPRYWKQVKRTISIEPGKYRHWYPDSDMPVELEILAWGYSDDSPEMAERQADERMRDIAEAYKRPERDEGFYYPNGVIREDVLERIEDGEDTKAVITRNRYGAEVLNTSGLMFVDIDVDLSDIEPPSFFQKLFGQAEKIQKRNDEITKERFDQALNKVYDYMRNDRDNGFFLYKTHSGLRLIAASSEFAPDSEETMRILDGLGSDPLFQRLCKSQKCFRARLTPKFWRMNRDDFDALTPSPTFGFRKTQDISVRWTSDDNDNLRYYDEWIRNYTRLSRNYATCQFLESVGITKVAPELKKIINLHDSRTGAYTRLPLA